MGLGLNEADRDDFVAAIRDEQSTDGPPIIRFFAKVRLGAIHRAAGLSTGIATELLLSLGRGFPGISG